MMFKAKKNQKVLATGSSFGSFKAVNEIKLVAFCFIVAPIKNWTRDQPK